jgi:SAM-dependent methyltransferase
MNMLDELRQAVSDERALREVEEGIYSLLPEAAAHGHLYDRRAAVYDFFVGTRLYNRVMWGDSPLRYAAFARRAFASTPAGRLLDAPCGSLLFSVGAYLASRRPVIALDQSIAMLRRARARLLDAAGRVPANVVFVQGDLSRLTFRHGSFQTILCMNVLHQYDDAATLIPQLKSLLTGEGHLFLTSIVTNGRFIGDAYMRMLHRAGEFVRPRSSVELKELLEGSLNGRVAYRVEGNMAYAATDAIEDLFA